MKDLEESTLGAERLYALVHPEDVLAMLGCLAHYAEAVFWLAILGWTEDAYLDELRMTGWRG